MISHAGEINWAEPVVAIPAFLTILMIPLTFSISNGLGFGFALHTLLRVLKGDARRVSWFVYVVTALFVGRFLFLRTA
jgi:AGZA family xanthine/uracil permease-like MFS transporter